VSDPSPHLAAALAESYRLERELGQGGMATVYLAEDLRHHRKVALKVLRPELAATLGPERFFREIEVAARLSHPHILPLHDSGEAQGFLYYVMPFVDGENLRGRLARQGELPVPEAVRLLADVADALAYAHGQGVVHRDIKPDNVLLSGRHALVTDFGVAKAVSEATGRQQLTTAGIALGTPAYMAPEQAAADPHLDHRVDIYALGAMGYELLTGRPPFTGASPHEVLAAHITRQPEPLLALRPACPPALAALIMRCLAKKPSDRPQSAEELVRVLETVSTPSSGITPTDTRPIPGLARRRRPMLLIALGAIVLAAGGAVLLWGHSPTRVTLGQQSRITDAQGLETDPTIAPDGRLIAYAAGPYFESHVYVRQLSGGPALDLTAGLPGRHTRPRWIAGGDELLFVTSYGRIRRVSRVSALGGTPRPMVELESDELIASADWSPDGKQVAYDLGGRIFITPASGGSARQVYDATDPHSISWSPDGRYLAFVEGGNRLWHGATGLANTAPSAILVLPISGGAPVTIAGPTALNLSPSWSSDRRSLFFVSSRDGAKDVWRASLTAGGALVRPPERLSTGLNAHTLALSHDGRTLAFSTLERESNVWMLNLVPGRTITDDAAVPVTHGNQVIERMSLSPDGRWLLYDSDRSGNADVYRLRLDHPDAEPERLTSDSANDYAPTLSPDGREIVFHSMRSGNRDLWIMGADGSNQRQLTRSPIEEYSGAWSPDGRTISYYADSAGTLWLGLISRDSSGVWGAPRLVLRNTLSTSWAPDGRRLAGVVNGILSVVTLPDLTVRPIVPSPGAVYPIRYPVWSADGRSILFRMREPDGRATLVRIPADGGAPVPLVRPSDARRNGPRADWTADERRFFFTLPHYEGDVWTVKVRQR
jgi:eukaryotic-like serine/threonine-protein kinase